MTLDAKITNLLQRIVVEHDWKFAIGVRIRFNNPSLLYQTYPQEWQDYYTKNALVMVDPTVRWGLQNTGYCTWSSLAEEDSEGVFAAAAKFGLNYGFAVSEGSPMDRSMGFFARSSGEFSESEMQEGDSLVKELHNLTDGFENWDPDDVAAARAIKL